MDAKAHEPPAVKAMRLLGAKRIAQVCDLTTNAVQKWPTQGRGFIPSCHQRAVLDLAKAQGVTLTAEDLIGAAA